MIGVSEDNSELMDFYAEVVNAVNEIVDRHGLREEIVQLALNVHYQATDTIQFESIQLIGDIDA